MSAEVTIERVMMNGQHLTRFSTYIYDKDMVTPQYMEEVMNGVMKSTIKAITEEYIAENKANIMFKIDQAEVTKLTTIEIAKEIAKGLAEEISRKIIKNMREEEE